MRLWSVFFGAVTVTIVTTMALPDPFGLTRVAQWGGMYTDDWCQGSVRTAPVDNPDDLHEHGLTIGNDPPVRMVWYAPQFTEETCLGWIRNKCGKMMFGERVMQALAMHRHEWMNGGQDVCTEPGHDSVLWFAQ